MGRPPILDKKLIHKIANKVRKPDLTIVKRVSSIASRKHIFPEVALILTANKYEIGSSSVFKKLNQQQQAQLNAQLNNGAIRKVNSSAKSMDRKNIKPVANSRIEFTDP